MTGTQKIDRTLVQQPNNNNLIIKWDEVRKVNTILTIRDVHLFYSLLNEALEYKHDHKKIQKWTEHKVNFKDFGYANAKAYREALHSIRMVSLRIGDWNDENSDVADLGIVTGWKHSPGKGIVNIKWDSDFLKDMYEFKYNADKVNYFQFFLKSEIVNKYYYPLLSYFLSKVSVGQKKFIIVVSEEQFRELTGTTTKHKGYKELNRAVIKPALEAINKTDNGLTIEFKKNKTTGMFMFKVSNTGIKFKAEEPSSTNTPIEYNDEAWF